MVTASLLVAGAIVAALPARAAETASEPSVSLDDANQQAGILASEDRRLTEVRTIASLARWQSQDWKTPYRLGMTSGYTLVLPPRSDPYTMGDLLELAPQTFLKMSDGSFLLDEHVIVMAGATLRLSRPGGVTLRLASDGDGFATIVSIGGSLEFVGERDAPLEVTSWDTKAGTVDDSVADGRAYIRAIGGQFAATYTSFARLGFWSGRTGGVALTGTDRPNTGAITRTGPQEEDSLLKDVTMQPAGSDAAQPAQPDLDFTVPEFDYASANLRHVTVTHDAFGIFVSGANGVQITDSEFTANSLGGVVFHRYVTNGAVSATTSSDNAGDGFTIDRASSGITISGSTAMRNAGSGFRLSGRPLAEGPSAVGASLESYGNNSVSNSTATDNGRYGIEVVGGQNIGLQSNTLGGHEMGVLVKGPATKISVVGNTVDDSELHGIAFVRGVIDSAVTGNEVESASTGIYFRDSSGKIKGNTVLGARSHGVSVVGTTAGTDISYNKLAGNGTSALDTSRADGDVSTTSNDSSGWHDTTPWYMWYRKLLQPMNALWAALAILLVVTAVLKRRGRRGIKHPYEHQMAHLGQPLSLPPLAASPIDPERARRAGDLAASGSRDVIDLTAPARAEPAATIGVPRGTKIFSD